MGQVQSNMYPAVMWPPRPHDLDEERDRRPCQISNGNPVRYHQCTAMSTAPQRNKGCVHCVSPWRVCIACVIQHSQAPDVRVADPEKGFCRFHLDNGPEAVWVLVEEPPRLRLVAPETPAEEEPIEKRMRERYVFETIMRIDALLASCQFTRKQRQLLGCLGDNLDDVHARARLNVPMTDVVELMRQVCERIGGLDDLSSNQRRRIIGEAWRVYGTFVRTDNPNVSLLQSLPMEEMTDDRIEEIAAALVPQLPNPMYLKGSKIIRILELSAEGHTDKEIARNVGVTPKGVSLVVGRFLRKISLPPLPGTGPEKTKLRRRILARAYDIRQK